MDYEVLLEMFLRVVFVPIVIYGLKIAQNYLQSKNENEQMNAIIAQAMHAVEIAVADTTQTYVDALKEQGMFTQQAHQYAFQMSKEKALSILAPKTQELLEQSFNDVGEYIQTLIEAEVLKQKGGY